MVEVTLSRVEDKSTLWFAGAGENQSKILKPEVRDRKKRGNKNKVRISDMKNT